MAQPSGTNQIQSQVRQILDEARKQGIQADFFFRTTLQRYITQLELLDALREEISCVGLTVKKSYARGSSNVYMNPAVTEYNKTASAANGTVATLIKIVESMDAKNPAEGGKLRTLLESLDCQSAFGSG